MATAVRIINTPQEYDQALTQAAGKLVVVDFTATWCGPCKAIAPVFDQLSLKYPHVVFLKVDVDKVQTVAQQAQVRAMPTFHFIKNLVKVADVVGAQVAKIEATIKQHEVVDGDAGQSSSQAKPQAIAGGHTDLAEYIEKKQVNSLNEDSKHTTRGMIDGNNHLLSDSDEQLMIEIPFSQRVKIHSIAIRTADKKFGPKNIKIYCNRSKLGFNEVESVPADQEITLSEADLAEGLLPLKYVKFQKVINLQIFVEDNQGGEDVTRIDSIVFYGSPEQTPNMKDFKRVAGKEGEAE